MAWTESFEPGIIQAIQEFGGNLVYIEKVSIEDDRRFGIDYSLELLGETLCCRVLRCQTSVDKRYYTITLRRARYQDYGGEWDKIVNTNYGSWYFWAWGRKPPFPEAGMFIDLDAMRHEGGFDLPFWKTNKVAYENTIFAYLHWKHAHKWCRGCFGLSRFDHNNAYDHSQRVFRYDWTDLRSLWSVLRDQK